MKTADIIRAILAPVREVTILLPLLLFWVLLALGVWGGALGVFMIVLALPPLFRFQTLVVETHARGQAPGAFDVELFNWVGNFWSLFPLLLAIAFGLAGYGAAVSWGSAGVWATIVVAALVLPASLAVLAITHSPRQALSPVALRNVYRRGGPTFLLAPVYVLLCAGLAVTFAGAPLWALLLSGLFVFFSVASLTGALIAPFGLVDDVSIPEGVEPDAKKIAGDIEKARMLALTHAYGFISRDNRKGGFEHLFAEIESDPDPAAAWAWYFDQMLGWEVKTHALFFGQHYVSDALRYGEDIRALKVILRCRYLDGQFRPFPEDVPAALAAAERHGNRELAEVLKQG